MYVIEWVLQRKGREKFEVSVIEKRILYTGNLACTPTESQLDL